jgi:hypothetical protein
MVAAACFNRGRVNAWPTLLAWSTSIGAAWCDFARVLGAPDSVLSAPSPTHADRTSSVLSFFAAAATTAESVLNKTRLAAADRVRLFSGSPRLAPGSCSSIHSVTNGHPNLWITALSHSSGLYIPPGDLTNPEQSAFAGLHVALLFGLPIWPSLGVLRRPAHCKHCLAAVHASSSVLTAARAPSGNPCSADSSATVSSMSSLDDFGVHITTCRRSGPLACNKTKHDQIVRRLADVSAKVGRNGRYHDGPIFTFGRKSRPADFLQNHVNFNRYPEGECVDFTSGLSSVRLADGREADKWRKYAPQFAFRPEYAFRTFGATHEGDVGPQAQSLLADWCLSLASRLATLRHPPCDVRGEIFVSVARSFTRATINQFVQWLLRPSVVCRAARLSGTW